MTDCTFTQFQYIFPRIHLEKSQEETFTGSEIQGFGFDQSEVLTSGRLTVFFFLLSNQLNANWALKVSTGRKVDLALCGLEISHLNSWGFQVNGVKTNSQHFQLWQTHNFTRVFNAIICMKNWFFFLSCLRDIEKCNQLLSNPHSDPDSKPPRTSVPLYCSSISVSPEDCCLALVNISTHPAAPNHKSRLGSAFFLLHSLKKKSLCGLTWSFSSPPTPIPPTH